jgi:hypothetical protein
MRSIGKWKIKKLNAIVQEEFDKMKPGQYSPWIDMDQVKLKENIKERIPAEWYDTWESAWSEIERLIEDGMSRLLYAHD